jgi:hypothetical protein
MRPDGVLVIPGVLSAVAGVLLRMGDDLRVLVWLCAIGPVVVANKSAIMRSVSRFKVRLREW